jgi:hypothetical protein
VAHAVSFTTSEPTSDETTRAIVLLRRVHALNVVEDNLTISIAADSFGSSCVFEAGV